LPARREHSPKGGKRAATAGLQFTGPLGGVNRQKESCGDRTLAGAIGEKLPLESGETQVSGAGNSKVYVPGNTTGNWVRTPAQKWWVREMGHRKKGYFQKRG